jgi:hypothetical protein
VSRVSTSGEMYRERSALFALAIKGAKRSAIYGSLAATVSRVASEVRNTRAHAAVPVVALPTESIVLS